MPTQIGHVQLQALIDHGALLVEVLPANEFAEAHLPGAVNLPLKQLNRQTTAQLDPEHPLIVYCHDFQ